MAAPKLVITSEPKLKLGAKGPNTENLQTFLTMFGYMPSPKAPKAKAKKKPAPKSSVAFKNMVDPFVATDAPPEFGTFDEATQMALKSFQAFHGLPPTGVLDIGTEAELNRPRCGCPDSPGGGSRVAAFALGPRWSKRNLRYRISRTSQGGLSPAVVEAAVKDALGIWSDSTTLTFTRVGPSAPADLDIRFEVGSHGDGDPFDGPFRVLAHAFFPEDGRVHFDDAEAWAMDFPPTNLSTIDLITVAAHEFGHALGLDHSSDRGALMFPTYSGPQRFLGQDDINGIRALYP
jgi:peptidoglycan hydrolase-like protein with peptidoglycan-binding domain